MENISELRIREFIPEKDENDLEQLLPAYLEICNAPENLKFLSFTFLPFDAEQIREWFKEHLEFGIHYFAVVNQEGDILGISVIHSTPIEGLELTGVGVLSSAKRRGIGRMLVQNAIDFARNEGFQAIDAQVFADNISMLRLLLDLHFLPVSMEHRRRADGADLVHLKKYL